MFSAMAAYSNSSLSLSTESSIRKCSQRYFCDLYGRKILGELNRLRLSGRFCDVKLSTEGHIVKAHKAVLSSCSPYFNAMFSNDLIEQQKTIIELPSLSPTLLSTLIDFVYTGEIQLDQSNVQELLTAADMFGVSEVVNACSNFMKKELDPSNCLGINKFAEIHNCIELASISKEFIVQNFIQISLCEEFLQLSKSELMELLKSEKLHVDSEFQVLQSALRWLQYNIKDRRQYIFDILKCVRFPLIPSNLLDKIIQECSDRSLKIALCGILRDIQLQLGNLVNFQVYPRECAKKIIYVIGGSKRELICSWTRYECTFETVETFDTFSTEWKKVSPMEIGRILPGVAFLNGKIYVVGGEQESKILANGEVYDPQQDSWKDMSCMIVPRCEFGLCALDECLYAIGGWVGEDIGGSIEKYDPKLDKWQMHSSMPEPRFSMGTIVYQGLIYVLGGCTHTQRHLRELLCYNPLNSEWTTLAPMLIPRSQMGVAVLDHYLYVVGGINRNNEVLKSAERYSFEQNTWLTLPSMKIGRTSPAVAAANGLLYVMGGDQLHEVGDFYRALVTISSVECFNPHTNNWTDCISLPESRSEAGAVVL